MFEQTFLVGTGRTRRPWTVPVSFGGQVAAVGFLVLVPLIFTERLPRAGLMPTPLTAPRFVKTHKPETRMTLVPVPRAPRPAGIFEPAQIPRGVAKIVDEPAPPALQVEACTGPCIFVENPVPFAQPPAAFAPRFDPPAPPAAPKPEPQQAVERRPERLVVGGVVQAGKLISRVDPVYPRLAASIRVSGVVRLKAVIGADGRIRELEVVEGHPLLVKAAVDAVRQWVYRPTRLNGNPVEIYTDIAVKFALR